MDSPTASTIGRLPVPAFVGSDEPSAFPASASLAPRRRSWQKRRFWGFVAATVGLAVVGVISWKRGQQTRVVVINDAGRILPSVRLTVSGQSHIIPPLAPEESHRWLISHDLVCTPVTLHSVDRQSGLEWNWEGEPIAPHDGVRLLLHLGPDGDVDADFHRSFWTGLAAGR